jgi:hypothetical protein
MRWEPEIQSLVVCIVIIQYVVLLILKISSTKETIVSKEKGVALFFMPKFCLFAHILNTLPNYFTAFMN